MKDLKPRNGLRKGRAPLTDGHLNRKLSCFFRNANKLSSYKPPFRNFITMSKLNALNSDCYIDIGTYKDQHFQGNIQKHQQLLQQSHTLYVGNLSFYTTEEQVYELFSKSGDVKRIIIGLDKVKKTACGFCFVEYYTRAGAENAMRFINGTRLDDRMIRTDWDTGFQEGRQYGRGKSGGQIRDEYRKDYDPARGGYGKMAQLNPSLEVRNTF